MKKIFKKIFGRIKKILGTNTLSDIYDLLVHKEFTERKIRHPNPIN